MALVRTIKATKAAEIFGVSRATMWRKIQSACIEPYRIECHKNGRKTFYYRESDIEKLQKLGTRQ